MELVFVGLLMLAATSYAWAREVAPIFRRLMRKRGSAPMHQARVRTHIHVKEKCSELIKHRKNN